jgi:hypothetical protein
VTPCFTILQLLRQALQLLFLVEGLRLQLLRQRFCRHQFTLKLLKLMLIMGAFCLLLR